MGKLTLLAKARKRASDQEALVQRIVQQVMDSIEVRDGRDGKDAPSLPEIMEEVRSLIPEAKIVEHKTVQQIKEEISDEKVRELIRQEIPEPLTPEIRVIEKEVELDTSGFLTKKEFKDALHRIDEAIRGSRGGAGNYTNLEARVKRLEELQEYVTFDRTDITFDSTDRTWDEE